MRLGKKDFFSGLGERFQNSSLTGERNCCLTSASVGCSEVLGCPHYFRHIDYSSRQIPASSLQPDAPLIESVISEAFGSSEKGEMVDRERGLQVEDGQRQPFPKVCERANSRLITSRHRNSNQLRLTHLYTPSLTFCPGEGSNMLTF